MFTRKEYNRIHGVKMLSTSSVPLSLEMAECPHCKEHEDHPWTVHDEIVWSKRLDVIHKVRSTVSMLDIPEPPTKEEIQQAQFFSVKLENLTNKPILNKNEMYLTSEERDQKDKLLDSDYSDDFQTSYHEVMSYDWAIKKYNEAIRVQENSQKAIKDIINEECKYKDVGFVDIYYEDNRFIVTSTNVVVKSSDPIGYSWILFPSTSFINIISGHSIFRISLVDVHSINIFATDKPKRGRAIIGFIVLLLLLPAMLYGLITELSCIAIIWFVGCVYGLYRVSKIVFASNKVRYGIRVYSRSGISSELSPNYFVTRTHVEKMLTIIRSVLADRKVAS